LSGNVGALGTLGAMLVEGRALNCENDDLRGIVPMNTGTDTLRFDPKPLVSHVNSISYLICMLVHLGSSEGGSAGTLISGRH